MPAWVCVPTDWTHATQHVLKVRIDVENLEESSLEESSTYHVSKHIYVYYE